MRRLLPLMSCLVLCMLPASALAATKPTAFLVTSTANSIASKGAPTLLAGDLKGTFGKGAVVIKVVKVDGDKATASFTLFTERGSLKGTTTFTFSTTGEVGPSGITQLDGSGAITSGTGSYKKAKGKFTVAGVSPSGEDYYQLKLKGSFTHA